MIGVHITNGDPSKETMSAMDKLYNDWNAKAARGECEWICSDCCTPFPDGMPDEFCYGHKSCTDIIKRDKAAATKEQPCE